MRPRTRRPPQLLEVNTGGAVFFLLFSPPSEGAGQQGGAGRSRLAEAAAPAGWGSVTGSSGGDGGGGCGGVRGPASSSGGGVDADASSTGSSSGAGAGACGPRTLDGDEPSVASVSLEGLGGLTLGQHNGSSGGGDGSSSGGGGGGRGEGLAVVKFAATRLAMQAEQFANELARHLGVAAPDCRIVRQAGPGGGGSGGGGEWAAARAAAVALGEGGAGLLAELERAPCFLLMEFVPGAPLLDAAPGQLQARSGWLFNGRAVAPRSRRPRRGRWRRAPTKRASLKRFCSLPRPLTARPSPQGPGGPALLEDLGRLLLLDMLLGNADRLPFPELGWRGNPSNIILGAPGGAAQALEGGAWRLSRPPSPKPPFLASLPRRPPLCTEHTPSHPPPAGSRLAGRAVAIDSCVPRRPPALKSCAEDAAAERVAQLLLAAPGVAAAVLSQLLGREPGAGGGRDRCSASGGGAGSAGGAADGGCSTEAGSGGGAAGAPCDGEEGDDGAEGAEAFQRGFREALSLALRIKVRAPFSSKPNCIRGCCLRKDAPAVVVLCPHARPPPLCHPGRACLR
jgi:hypothetical protein